MTYAAFFELHADQEITRNPTALRVYAHLLCDQRMFFQPIDVKVWLIARKLGAHRDSVAAAINLLIERGYVVDHGRNISNVRRLTIALRRVEKAACHPN